MKYNKIQNQTEILSDDEKDDIYIKNKELDDEDNDEKDKDDDKEDDIDKDKEEDKDEYDIYDDKDNEKEKDIDDDLEDECIYEEIDVQNKSNKSKKINDEDRITINKLTKYEKAKIICARSQQIENGSKIMLKYDGDINKLLSIQIAELELQNKVIPILIKRYLPNGDYEIWKISELI